MSNSKNSFAELIKSSKLMVTGMKSHKDAVAKRGIDMEFINSLETMIAESERLNAEQEKLKAEAKQKTADLNEKQKQIQKKISEAKKVVKLALSQTIWTEFGIDDKK